MAPYFYYEAIWCPLAEFVWFVSIAFCMIYFLLSEHLAEFSIPSSFYYARVFWIVFNNNLLETRKSLWQRAKARNVSFKTLYGGQFTLSTQLIILNYPVILSHRRRRAESKRVSEVHRFKKTALKEMHTNLTLQETFKESYKIVFLL